ncbi:MAG: relaxase/mobilization nuclease domain-containing protein [Oscillospiraceae bacterium]|nr:relaxase/mobilization nuclease domain-containing protein [Oscillospiraceae bacterium]
MATTRIIPLHQNKGKTVAQCLYERTSYAINPEKTENYEYVSSFECSPGLADAEFTYSKRIYAEITGRDPHYKSGKQHDVLAYQVRQSFKPGEVTPEEANKIGYEFASRFLKGRHAFLVATHTDKKHIHNHIIWNSTTLDCTQKFRDFRKSGRAVRILSDIICLEHGLSVVDKPKRKSTISYNKWLGDEAHKPTNRSFVREAIDEILSEKPTDFSDFLSRLQRAGFTIKIGAHITLSHPNFKKNIRMNSLGKGYTEDEIRAIIEGRLPPHISKKKRTVPAPKAPSLLIDIQAALDAGKGPGYANWAKHFNLTQMARAMLYLKEHGLVDYNELSAKASDSSQKVSELRSQIRDAETRMKEISRLKTQLINYSKTKPVYSQYRAKGYAKKFYTAHTDEIEAHKAAKRFFDETGLSKLPSVKELSAEYQQLAGKKDTWYRELHGIKDEQHELVVCKRIVDEILSEQKNISPPRKDRDIESR